jgi:tetrapyrrole methylase family protein/MazG family protein
MAGEKMPELAVLMARLRSAEGCPWDREQSHDSLKIYLIEEAYEVVQAIESQNATALREELGDLLLQIVFHAQIATEAGDFSLNDVIHEIQDKLVRRHPHVFGEVDMKTSQEVVRNWEAIKAAENEDRQGVREARRKSVLDGTPENLPPLVQAYQLTSRASRVGFDWQKPEDIFNKLDEEIQELRDCMGKADRQAISEEIGDLLFVMVNLARHLHVDPELALRRTNRKFNARFRYMEQQLEQEGRPVQRASLEEMDRHWEKSKSQIDKGEC